MPAEQIWRGRGMLPATARMALMPLSAGYGLVMRTRRWLFDRGVLESVEPGLPVISIGNLTVGGTGKTPVAAWVAARLRDDARPAILLRGYGTDEIAVHERLNPGIPVVASADRIAGVAEAGRRGADVVVADDAFQHRRLRRVVDIVLISAEQWDRPRQLLPAGPWREAPEAAARADLVLVTRKVASRDTAARVAGELRARTGRPVGIGHLAAGPLTHVRDGTEQGLESLKGRVVLAVAAIGEPEVFRRQLEHVGATVTLAAFRDHHAFTEGDVAALAARTPAGGLVVCTLKDAVKLAALWPASSPLWYVSQHLVVEEGMEHLNQLLKRLLDARVTTTTAG